MEKQVNWRVLSELWSRQADGGGGKAPRRGGERQRFVSSRTVMGLYLLRHYEQKGEEKRWK